MLEYATCVPFDAITEPYQLGSRVDSRLVDVSARTGYALVGAKRTDPHAQASEYYQVFAFKLTCFFFRYSHPSPGQFDWEYAQSPSESSLIASSWVLSRFSLQNLNSYYYREITLHMTLMRAGFQTIT